MVLQICVLAVMAVLGEPVDRTVLFFTSENCPTCASVQQNLDLLASEGLKVRYIDADQDLITAERFRVVKTPSLIVIDRGREVERIVNDLSPLDLRKRLARSSPPAQPAPALSQPESNSRVIDRSFVDDSLYGANHPYYKTKNANLAGSVESTDDGLYGVNHPYYQKRRSNAKSGSAKSGSARSASARSVTGASAKAPSGPIVYSQHALHPTVGLLQIKPSHLPVSPETMAATVRIRVHYQNSNSVGTGTIIQTVDDVAIVLTCGHLFQNGPWQSITVELFRDNKPIMLPAEVVDVRKDRVDLAVIRFRTSLPLSAVGILPKGEAIRERDSVFSIGCDFGADPSRRNTIVTRLNRYIGKSNLQIAGAPVQGRSGGGLFDNQGRLIGVCYAADNELDEGLYVGPESIYEELEKVNLSQLFQVRSKTP